MLDTIFEKELLMTFIDGVISGDISREQISQRIDMFSIVVCAEQRDLAQQACYGEITTRQRKSIKDAPLPPLNKLQS